MMQADISTPLDANTHLSTTPQADESTPGTGTNPLVYAAAISAVYLLRKQIFSPAGLLFAAGFVVAKRVKTGRVQAALQGLVQEQTTFTINKPAEELYAMWLDTGNAPSYQESISSVTDKGDGVSHWIMDLPGGKTLEWDAQWTAQEPGKRLAWHTIGETPVPSAGQVTFEPAASGRGTVVRVNQEFLLPGGKVAAALGGLFSRTPGGFVRENLRHFKQLAEAGEVATTKGQPVGKRSAFTAIPQALEGDREQQTTSPATGAIVHQEVA